MSNAAVEPPPRSAGSSGPAGPAEAGRIDLRIAVLATAFAAFGPLSMTMYTPGMPAIVADLATDAAATKLTLTLYMASFAIGQLLWGPLSDRTGRRPALALGLVVYVAGCIAAAVAPTVEALMAARLIQGLGACVGPTVARAVIRDLYAGAMAARVLSLIGMVLALAPAAGQLIGGGLVEVTGWRATFALLALFGVTVWIVARWQLRETNLNPDPRALAPRRMAVNYVTLLGNGTYLSFAVPSAAAYAGLFAYTASAPFVLIDQYGLSPLFFGLYSFGPVVGLLLGMVVVNRTAHRVGQFGLMIGGVVLCALAGALMTALLTAYGAAPLTVFPPMALWLFGFGLLMPGSQAGALSPFPRMAGTASAMLGFLQMGAGGLGTVIAAALDDGGMRALAIVPVSMAATGLILFTLIMLVRRQRKTDGKRAI